MTVNTTPSSFGDLMISEIYGFIHGTQSITVSVEDNTSINAGATRLQYGIASPEGEAVADVIGWTDFGSGSSGALDLNWGNVIYSDVWKWLISSAISRVTTVQLRKEFNLIAISAEVTFTSNLIDLVAGTGTYLGN